MAAARRDDSGCQPTLPGDESASAGHDASSVDGPRRPAAARQALSHRLRRRRGGRRPAPRPPAGGARSLDTLPPAQVLLPQADQDAVRTLVAFSRRIVRSSPRRSRLRIIALRRSTDPACRPGFYSVCGRLSSSGVAGRVRGRRIGGSRRCRSSAMPASPAAHKAARNASTSSGWAPSAGIVSTKRSSRAVTGNPVRGALSAQLGALHLAGRHEPDQRVAHRLRRARPSRAFQPRTHRLYRLRRRERLQRSQHEAVHAHGAL